MNIHKNTRLLPHHREAIRTAYHKNKQSVTSLALEYKVSRPIIYKVLKLARIKLLKPQTSTNNRFKQAKYGIKRLDNLTNFIQDKLKRQAKRYNKSYPLLNKPSYTPNTTNKLEGLFSQLKQKLSYHQGLSQDRQIKFIDDFMMKHD